MADNFIIPLSIDSHYDFNVELDDHSYEMTTRWNGTDEAWYLDILGVTNNVDQKGIKLVTGPNLLKPFPIIELGGLYMVDLQGEDSEPNYDDIGDRYVLLYVPVENTSQIL